MSEKCTLTPEERAEAWKKFSGWTNVEEDEEINDLFGDYLIHWGRAPKKNYYCTKCGAFEAVGWPELGRGHNIRYNCPNCGAEVTLKALRYLSTFDSMREKHNIVIFRKSADGALLISAGQAVRHYVHSDYSGFDPDEILLPVARTDFYERRRYYLAPGKVAAWKRWAGEPSYFRWFYGETETPWEPMKTANEPNPLGSFLYPQPDDGLYFMVGRDIIHETALKYSQVESYFDYAWTEPPCAVRNVVSYLVSYCVRPQLEMLVKLEYTDVVEELLLGHRNAHLVNWKAKTPPAFFRMSKTDYRAFFENVGTLEKLRFFSEHKGEFDSFSEFMTVTKSFDRYTFDRASVVAKQIERPIKEVLRKVKRKDLSFWMDYIHMAREENLDLSVDTVVYPKNLKERHDALSEMIKLRESEAELQKYQRRYKALCRRYEFEFDGLCIVVPVSSSDIVEEGQAMHHCVAGYATRHILGRLDILFLRDANTGDRRATIEMNGDGMTQIRGPYNDRDEVPAEERYKYFTDVWLDWVRRGSRRDTAGNPIMIEKVGVA